MDIYTLDGTDLDFLINVAQRARENGQRLSVAVEGGIKVKRGESMWTPPLGRPLITLSKKGW